MRALRQNLIGLMIRAWVGGVVMAGASASADTLDLVLARAAVPSDSPVTEAGSRASVAAFGTEGSADWWIGGMAGAEVGITNLAAVRGGVDWFVATDFSIGLQADLGWAAPEGRDGGMLVGIAPILRWHFLHRDHWTLFAELGVGAAWTTTRIPVGGTRFNFSPQAGLGATFALGDDWRLRTVLGWYHMSNARTGNNNPGLDAVAITIGIGRSF